MDTDHIEWGEEVDPVEGTASSGNRELPGGLSTESLSYIQGSVGGHGLLPTEATKRAAVGQAILLQHTEHLPE